MPSFFIKLFIRDYKDIHNPKVRAAYGTLSSAVGIFVNAVLSVAKFMIGTLTGSIAIAADAANNLSDAGSSVVTLLGFKASQIPADKNHPYGHGRIEYISGLVVAFLVLLMGFDFLETSIEKIRHPQEVIFSSVALIVLILSILLKLWLAYFNYIIGKKTNSTANKAVFVDSLSDTAATSVALVALLLSKYTSVHVDGWFGIFVAGFILFSGFSIAKDTISPLLGQPPAPEFLEEIEKKICSYDGVLGVHDLIVHDYGPGRLFASAHAEVPANVDILQSHDTIDLIERDIHKEYNMLISIHLDPVVTDDEEVTKLKNCTSSVVKSINPEFSIHDFRMVKGPTHTNLIFDVLVPYGTAQTEDEIQNLIREKLSKIDERFFCVITIDYAFH